MAKKQWTDEAHALSELALVITINVFSVIMILMILLLKWDTWAIPLQIGTFFLTIFLQIRRSLFRIRIYIYAFLFLVQIFYYSVHAKTIYDITPVVLIALILFVMAGERTLVWTTIGVGGFSMIWHLVSEYSRGELDVDLPEQVRIIWCFLIILIAGYLADRATELIKQNIARYRGRIDELEEENDRVNSFLTNVSHEIRTPINVVTGMTSVMQQKTNDPEMRRNLVAVNDAGHRISTQISDILDYTEIDMDKLMLNTETYSISSLVNNLVDELQPYLKPEVELVIDIDPELPSQLTGDAFKIGKILWHLTMNGIKYTKDGGVLVKIYGTPKPYGINLCLTVSDTGIGLSKKELNHLFDKFYQADSGKTRAFGGLGLGLPIVRGFVRSMGGFLTVESTEGRGTTVSVTIPQEVADRTGCMSLTDNRERMLATYLRFEDIKSAEVREHYNILIRDLAIGFRVPFYRIDHGEDLRRLAENYPLTHLIVGSTEYEEEQEYLEELARRIVVVVVADKSLSVRNDSSVIVLPKPFYCFPLVSFLNRGAETEVRSEENTRLYCPGVSVLVVDDERMNLIVAEGIFSSYGMLVTTVMSGQEAVDLCRTRHFDLIFMDHMMPEMDGIEAMKRIRAQSPEGRDLKIIALTANAVSSARDMFLSEGFNGFVAKPVVRTELDRVLKRELPVSMFSDDYETNDRTSLSEGGSSNTRSFLLSRLESGGIKAYEGLEYAQNDENFYRILLCEFEGNAPDKSMAIQNSYEEKDPEGYAIRVHALKSTSRMIGATELSALAAQLEQAAKNGDLDTIRAHHGELMEKYERATEVIRDVIGRNEVVSSPVPEDEVLEFLPEEDG